MWNLIHWLGYSASEDTWQAGKVLEKLVAELIADYLALQLSRKEALGRAAPLFQNKRPAILSWMLPLVSSFGGVSARIPLRLTS